MARSVQTIKKEMTDAFIANPVIKNAYSLNPNKTFDEQFSTASIESIIFYIVAVAINKLEGLFDLLTSEIDKKIREGIAGTAKWYHSMVMNFEYAGEKPIRFCSVQEGAVSLIIKVNTADYGVIGAESDMRIALNSYIASQKFAGTQINIVSNPPETIDMTIKVWLDANRYSSDGVMIIGDSSDKTVEVAIDNYMQNIPYDGVFYRTKLVDAIQAVEGVYDVELQSVKIGNLVLPASYQAVNGAFKAEKNIVYVLV